MHREIMGLVKGDGQEVDHINRDRHDNRRENLRIGTRALNGQNLSVKPGCASRHRGVSWDKRRNRWSARVKVQGVLHWLGYFDREEDAAAAASAFRAKYMPFSEDAMAA